jgi:hypothetical protein
VTHLSVVPALPAQRTAEPTTGPEEYDDDLRLVPVRLLLALDGRCSCDACCRAWLAGDERAGVVKVSRPRLRVVGH